VSSVVYRFASTRFTRHISSSASQVVSTIAVSIAALTLDGAAWADILVIPAAADTAPYSFLPSLVRYNNSTLYAFESFDENGTPHDFETFLAFDVEQADLPSGHVLVEATLLVTYAFDFTGFGEPSIAPGEIACREILEPWSQTTLTWLNRPDVDEPFDTVTGITDFGALLCDATSVVLGWLTERTPNDGIALTNATERVIGMHSIESSADPSLRPQLILRTALPEPGVAPTLVAGAVGLAFARRRRGACAGRTARAEESRHVGA
jgi:hypothetical protein